MKLVGFDVLGRIGKKRQECCVTKSIVKGEREVLYNCYEVNDDVWITVLSIK